MQINEDILDCGNYLIAGGKCTGLEVHCEPKEPCTITCSSSDNLGGSSLNCARDHQCTININGQNWFKNINGAEDSLLTVNVNSPNGNIRFASIRCPESALCDVNCIRGDGAGLSACFRTQIS